MWQLKPKSVSKMVEIQIHSQTIKAEVARSMSERALGLGNRESLESNRGMLFLFPDLGYPSIWMKNMNFPIDIVWLKDSQVVDIAKEVPIPDPKELQMQTYSPKELANQVLEIKSGQTDILNLKIGDKITILD